MTKPINPQYKLEADYLEHLLRIKFPQSYYNFLITEGYYFADDSADEVYGVGAKLELYESRYNNFTYKPCDLLHLYLSNKDFFGYGNKVIPIYDCGNGDCWAINLNQYDKTTKEAPIWYLSHEGLHSISHNMDSTGYWKELPDYSKTSEEYTKLGYSYWQETNYTDFAQWYSDLKNNKLDFAIHN
jgi:SMI1 / KNR4 family (SUKH-1)